MSGVSGDFPVQLATRLPDWSAGGVVLPVCPCVVSFSKVKPPTRTTCCGQVASIHIASSSDTPDFLVTC